jgi:hypothetical protein
MPSCWFCRADLPYRPAATVPRESECPACGRDLHSCRNCRHYDPGVNNKCREPNAEWISERERANFCDFFQIAESPRGASGPDRAAEARKKLDDLFKKPE